MGYLVTGGRSPIALDIAHRLASSGHDVTLVTRQIDSELASRVEDGERIMLFECDLSQDTCVSEILEACVGDEDFKGAVFAHRYRDDEDIQRQYALEVVRPARIIRAIASQTFAASPAFVFLTSPAAHSNLSTASLGYHLAKSGINSLVRFLSSELGDLHIRVNAVSPGAFVEKERSREYFRQNPAKVNWANVATPLGRFLQPREISEVVMFLLDERASFVTGQVIEVDGGISNRDLATFGDVFLEEK